MSASLFSKSLQISLSFQPPGMDRRLTSCHLTPLENPLVKIFNYHYWKEITLWFSVSNPKHQKLSVNPNECLHFFVCETLWCCPIGCRWKSDLPFAVFCCCALFLLSLLSLYATKKLFWENNWKLKKYPYEGTRKGSK